MTREHTIFRIRIMCKSFWVTTTYAISDQKNNCGMNSVSVLYNQRLLLLFRNLTRFRFFFSFVSHGGAHAYVWSMRCKTSKAAFLTCIFISRSRRTKTRRFNSVSFDSYAFFHVFGRGKCVAEKFIMLFLCMVSHVLDFRNESVLCSVASTSASYPHPHMHHPVDVDRLMPCPRAEH